MFLTFPIMVMKVSTIGDNNVTLYRWKNMIIVGIGAFFLSFFWRWALERNDRGGRTVDENRNKGDEDFKEGPWKGFKGLGGTGSSQSL